MKKLSLVTVLIFFMAVALKAQKPIEASHDLMVKVPSYALVGLSSASGIALEPAAPTVAGDGMDFTASTATDNSVWLNYSSGLKNKNQSNSISVSMTGDDLPIGVTIELVASEDAGNGNGTLGTTGSKVLVLKKQSQDVVSGIGNCYTGTGSGSGHQLVYTLKMDQASANYSALVSGDYTTTITYTITEK